MAGMERIQKWFDELSEKADAIAASMKTTEEDKKLPGGFRTHDGRRSERVTVQHIDGPMFIEWQASVLSLLGRIFGNDHSTYQRFDESCRANGHSLHSSFTTARANFQSAKSDFEGGYLFDVCNLVHSEVFSDELDQAKHLLDKGFKVPAAVIAGTVLETTLRRICDAHDDLEPSDNINSMNDDLYKANVYGKAVTKQVGSWGDIRNDAAHGRPDEFDHVQVVRMIEGIRDFVVKQLS